MNRSQTLVPPQPAWRESIVTALRLRNCKQIDPYRAVFVESNRLARIARLSQEKIMTLEVDLRTLRAQNDLGVSSSGSGSGTMSAKAAAAQLAKTVELEQKVTKTREELFKAREELTEAFREKNSRTEMILTLTAQSQTKDTEINALKAEIVELKGAQTATAKQLKDMKTMIDQKESHVQILEDELQALQLELISVGEQLKRVKTEKESLEARWLKKAEEDVEKMNAMNEARKSDKLTEDLAEATSKPVRR